ncbi:MAG: SPOR domain-containing protein [candidate division WOR-3 bacterium]
MKYLYVAFSIFLLLGACVKEQTVKEETPTEVIFEEVPSLEDTSSIVFEEVTPSAPQVETPFSGVTSPTPKEKEAPSVTPIKRQGYRIQIGAFRDEGEANILAARARAQLGKKVYVQYIPPFYKVRVGDFLDKYEATQYMNQYVKGSYERAWVVESEINVE